MREGVVGGEYDIKVGFRDPGQIAHIRNFKLNREAPLLWFASGSRNGGRTSTHQSMPALGQSEVLRPDAAGSRESLSDPWQLPLDEGTQNARLPMPPVESRLLLPSRRH